MHYNTSPDPEEVKRNIGGDLAAAFYIKNTCVVRVCEALNKCGSPMHHIQFGKGMKTKKGADHLNYGYRVREFREYMKDIYREVHIIKEKGDKINKNDFINRQGIIAFGVSGWEDATGHFSLWDGHNVLYQGGHEYFGLPTYNPLNGHIYLTDVMLWICEL
ncbi:T6SS effector amidase Tae4 family protein [Taibaiella soli]|nr:T6SS effector amidase Tae4 family protein [Taibaiella soli]